MFFLLKRINSKRLIPKVRLRHAVMFWSPSLVDNSRLNGRSAKVSWFACIPSIPSDFHPKTSKNIKAHLQHNHELYPPPS